MKFSHRQRAELVCEEGSVAQSVSAGRLLMKGPSYCNRSHPWVLSFGHATRLLPMHRGDMRRGIQRIHLSTFCALYRAVMKLAAGEGTLDSQPLLLHTSMSRWIVMRRSCLMKRVLSAPATSSNTCPHHRSFRAATAPPGRVSRSTATSTVTHIGELPWVARRA